MSRNLVFALLATLSAGAAHAASSGPYTMEILVAGGSRPEYAARGTTYVEALQGREYTIRLRNLTGRRVGVALSVDGLNTIDAKRTTAGDARKWILDPWQTIDLDGWQTSSSTARRFFFTDEKRSYGAWLGKTSDLGVVAAAFFPETLRELSRSYEQPVAGAPSAPSAESRVRQDAAADSLAATGIGRETRHDVRSVAFEHESTPAAVVSIRYEYHDALVRLGVVPRGIDEPLARREGARGFEDLDFAPDPYRRRR